MIWGPENPIGRRGGLRGAQRHLQAKRTDGIADGIVNTASIESNRSWSLKHRLRLMRVDVNTLQNVLTNIYGKL
jgi:hypothetical protein